MRNVVVCAALAIACAAAPAAAAPAPRVISFIGDSTTSSVYSPPGYPVLVGKLLGVKIHNLAVKYPPSYNMAQALQEELPHLPPDTTDAVLSVGIDDLRLLARGEETLASVEATNAEIVAALRKRKLRIYEFTLRDYTRDRAFVPQPYDTPTMSRIGGFANELNMYFRATAGVTIVEAASWDDVYAGKWSSDGIHCNPQSLQRFAAHVAEALAR